MHARFGIVLLAAIAACSGAYEVSAGSKGRPGLGTLWGETRTSILREVPFERASGGPFAQAAISYDDRDGLGSAAGREELSEGTRPGCAGFEMLVVDDRGRPFETVWAGGGAHVVGAEGERYRLRVHNRTARRVEVVTSVDGLDVIDGRRASLDKRGYLVNPFGTLTIEGFRLTTSEVAAFRFGAVSDSYAARTGDDRNVGVIGFAFFDERDAVSREDDRSDEAERRRNARPFSDPRFAQPPRM